MPMLDPIRFTNHHVFSLDITVNNSDVVSRLHGRSDLNGDVENFEQR